MKFIYAGSQRHMIGEIFTSPSRPFYQSTAIIDLRPIDRPIYTEFIKIHFETNRKKIAEETIHYIYNRFEGITWYIQFVANVLYTMTGEEEICTVDKVDIAIENILSQLNVTYSSLLFQLPPKQKEVLIAISKEGKAKEITS